jgi:ADP-ribose pyrophosphatase
MTAKKSTAKNKTSDEIAKNAAPEAQEAAKSSPVAEKTDGAVKPVKSIKPSKPGKPGKPGKTARAIKAKKSASASKDSKGAAKKSVTATKKSLPKSIKKPVKLKAVKPVAKPKITKKDDKQETEEILDSQVAFEGPLFRVLRDHIIEPGGRESHRDVIRHNGSVVILAIDHESKKGKKKKDPWVVIERQYRHAAGQFLWELPAGKLDAGEAPVDGAKRELAEETGYQAKKWSELVVYFASPGFLGESMKVFLAEGLVAGEAHPEEDEHIDFRLVKLSDLLEMIDKGKILDGKTLTSVLLYARQLGIKRKG